MTATLTNGTFDSNGFALADVSATPTLFWSTFDLNPMWTGSHLLFWTTVYKQMILDDEVVALLLWVGESLIAGSDDLKVFAESWNIKYKIDGTSRFWVDDNGTIFWTDDLTLFWDGNDFYKTWPGIVGPLLRQRYLFRITTEAGKVQGKVEKFDLRVDIPL